MSKLEIKKATDRAKLTPRREPYWIAADGGDLGFRCTGPDGAGTWIGRKRVTVRTATGTAKRTYAFESFGRLPYFNDAQAKFKAWIADLVTAELAGVEVSAVQTTVADAAANYLSFKIKTRGEKSDSVAQARSIIERFLTGREATNTAPAILPHRMASIRLADLTERDFVAFKASLIQDRDPLDVPRPQLNTASRNFAPFKAMLNKAVADRLTASDAAWRLVFDFGDNSPTSEDSYRYMSLDERTQIVEAMPSKDLRNLVKLLCMTGARPKELLQAMASDYNKLTKRLRLYSYKGKRAKMIERFVPVGAMGEALPVLLDQLKDKLPTAPLFNLTYGQLKSRVAAAVPKLDIEHASSYCFRHSFITDTIIGGASILEAAQITGTSAAMIEKTYGKLRAESVARTFSKLKFA